MAPALSEDQKQGMSPDEIELMEGGLDETGAPVMDDTDELAAKAATIATQPDDEDEDDEAEEKPAPAEKVVVEVEVDEDDEKPATVEVVEEAGEAEPDEQVAPVPQLTADVPADGAAQIKALAKEHDDAFDKLIDGTMTKEAYREVKSRTDEAIDELKTQALTAAIFRQANEQAARADWLRVESQQMKTFKAEGIDYQAKPALLAAFNVNLKALGNDPQNDTKDAAWFLSQAHAKTKEDLGIVVAAPAPAVKVTVKQKSRDIDLSKIPPTLGRVPPAADPTIAGDEFAHLANLSGVELEKAVTRMTPEQQDRWLP